MHLYSAKQEAFYTDLSDLLLLTSIGLTNPDRELAEGLTNGTYFSDLLACTEGVAGAFNSSIYTSHVMDALEDCTDACLHLDSEEVYTHINREYNRLFINPRNELVPLYESILVHPEEKKATMFINATCMHAEQTYRHTGFAFDEKNKVPGDHVAIELRYLAYLFASYMNAVQTGNEASCKAVKAAVEDFCSAHVRRWLGTFIDQIQANSNEPFYLLMAQVLEFVEPVLLG